MSSLKRLLPTARNSVTRRQRGPFYSRGLALSFARSNFFRVRVNVFFLLPRTSLLASSGQNSRLGSSFKQIVFLLRASPAQGGHFDASLSSWHADRKNDVIIAPIFQGSAEFLS
jgi:hypothetical protein